MAQLIVIINDGNKNKWLQTNCQTMRSINLFNNKMTNGIFNTNTNSSAVTVEISKKSKALHNCLLQ